MSKHQMNSVQHSEIVMVLAAYIDGQYVPMGSCVSIGENLVLTATHVLEDLHKKAGGKHPVGYGGEVACPVYAIQFVTKGEITDHRMWIVRELFGLQIPYDAAYSSTLMPIGLDPSNDVAFKSDLAVLRVEPLSGLTGGFIFPKTIIDFRHPSIESNVTALGYPSMSAKKQHDDMFNFSATLTQSTGQVKEVHLESRDTRVLPFPCFHSNLNIQGGMSGGPVFNDSGNLCGISCNSTDTMSEAGEYTSYVSLLWPLVFFPIRLALGNKNSLVYSLFESTQLEASGLDIYKVSKNGNGLITDIKVNLARGNNIHGGSDVTHRLSYNPIA